MLKKERQCGADQLTALKLKGEKNRQKTNERRWGKEERLQVKVMKPVQALKGRTRSRFVHKLLENRRRDKGFSYSSASAKIVVENSTHDVRTLILDFRVGSYI